MKRGYGYTTSPVAASSDGARCDAPSCTKPATRRVQYVASSALVAEKLLCRGHAPTRGHTYRREVA